MSTPQHTQGPWVTSERGENYYNEIKATSKRGKTWVIARLSAAKVGHEQARANARLIAAAPELLEVLQELEESSSYWSDYDVPVGIVDRIKAAITRATGKES